jgi:regulator of sigma E protease
VTIIPKKETYATPDGEQKEMGLIGIKPAGHDVLKKYGLPEAVSLGLKRTWDISALTLVSMVKLIQRVIPSSTIGGPIMIFQMAGEQASQGALNFFTFMAVISINLGVLNLLPIPILDGGHILFLGIEAVRRKPLSENAIMIAQRVGLVFLLSLMAFAFYNDIVRLFAGKVFQ